MRKGTMSKGVPMALLILTTIIVSGCATRSMYTEANKSFSKGFDAANQTLSQVLGTAARDARLQSIGYYIENGDDKINITSKDIIASFARYVCAGFGLYVTELGSINTLDAYKKHIAKLSSEPSDDLRELIGSIRNLDTPQPILELPTGSSATIQDGCRQAVVDNLPPGASLDQPVTEGLTQLFAATDQINTLIGSLKSAAVGFLKVIDDAKRAKALRVYIINNQETIRAIFDGYKDENGTIFLGLANTDALADAWAIHRKASLVVPYYQFRHLLHNLDRKTQVDRILKQEATVHESLQPYDQLGVTPSPERVVESMRKAQQNLLRLANGELSPGEAWAAFVVFTDSVEAVRDSVTTAADAVKAVNL